MSIRVQLFAATDAKDTDWTAKLADVLYCASLADVRRRTIMTTLRRFLVILTATMLSACASSDFVSSWKAPDAQPLQVKGSKVAAVVMMSNEAARRVAEDALAREITARGAVGIPMYAIYPDMEPKNEAAARVALEQAGALGVVVMRPVSVEKNRVTTPVTYSAPMYREYWGAYYGAGWGTPWGLSATSGGDVPTTTNVSVETLVYSLKQNKLVWGGQSRLTSPSSINQTIKKLAGAAAKELQKQGLMPARS
jgi:hypothetical protein